MGLIVLKLKLSQLYWALAQGFAETFEPFKRET